MKYDEFWRMTEHAFDSRGMKLGYAGKSMTREGTCADALEEHDSPAVIEACDAWVSWTRVVLALLERRVWEHERNYPGDPGHDEGETEYQRQARAWRARELALKR